MGRGARPRKTWQKIRTKKNKKRIKGREERKQRKIRAYEARERTRSWGRRPQQRHPEKKKPSEPHAWKCPQCDYQNGSCDNICCCCENIKAPWLR